MEHNVLLLVKAKQIANVSRSAMRPAHLCAYCAVALVQGLPCCGTDFAQWMVFCGPVEVGLNDDRHDLVIMRSRHAALDSSVARAATAVSTRY